MNQPVMDHWTTVKRIHQSALDVDPSERAAFVEELCGGDEALRREVHSLLAYATDAETFLERPAADITTAPPPRFWRRRLRADSTRIRRIVCAATARKCARSLHSTRWMSISRRYASFTSDVACRV